MKRNYWRGFLLVLAVGMVITGISRGELGIVLAKAARICLECIGLG